MFPTCAENAQVGNMCYRSPLEAPCSSDFFNSAGGTSLQLVRKMHKLETCATVPRLKPRAAATSSTRPVAQVCNLCGKCTSWKLVLQFSVKSSVQQRFLQLVERGECAFEHGVDIIGSGLGFVHAAPPSLLSLRFLGFFGFGSFSIFFAA